MAGIIYFTPVLQPAHNTNIAYLVLAHNQPRLLARLVERLSQSNVWFYIHVDRKSADREAIEQMFSGRARVKIISAYNVNWMGFSMVQSTIALLELARGSGNNFKYYVLMSGQDYPIKSNDYINRFFAEHGEDFISFAAIGDSADNYKDKVRRYHYYDLPYSNPRSPAKVGALVYLYYGLQKHLMRRLPTRKFYRGMQPYFGSQWFALTGETVRYVLNFIKENKGYLKFMKYTEGPDETFFQTIVLNSERRMNVYDYGRYEKRKGEERRGFVQEYSSLRYMDWGDHGPNVPKPAVLDESYFDELRRSSDLFARKVSEQKSGALMDKIDKALLNI